MTKVNRLYGIERSIGSVFYSKKEKVLSAIIDLGVFGHQWYTLKPSDGGYEWQVNRKDGTPVTLMRTFPVKKKDGTTVVEGITQGTFGLLSQFDKERGRTITSNNDCVMVSTHKLKKPKEDGDNVKVGYIMGRFAFENPQAQIDEKEVEKGTVRVNRGKKKDDELDEIPF